MTSQNTFGGRNRDIQDGAETHLWGKLEYVEGQGAVMRVKGTGTQDDEVTLINTGFGFNLPEDTDAEVTVLADGSDTNNKYAMPHIPHGAQRAWREMTGGVQNPMDPNKALEFNPKMAHILEQVVALGTSGMLEVNGGQVIIRGDLIVEGSTSASVRLGPIPSGAPIPAPAFEPYEG